MVMSDFLGENFMHIVYSWLFLFCLHS